MVPDKAAGGRIYMDCGPQITRTASLKNRIRPKVAST